MHHKKRTRRGFTLSELMISLVMGLIVSLAAVGLARTATTTFYEQARSSTTEMSLRMASSRLRGDLSRASYMSTGNIVFDPKVARLAGAADISDIAVLEKLLSSRVKKAKLARSTRSAPTAKHNRRKSISNSQPRSKHKLATARGSAFGGDK